ncbi:MurR/RpiR family transcriptional regulator [Clostridium saccharoperbutylacetonicum]|uniref:MurR/RpiR family transcriptional regulator n=1 Tax=Clostridium saccharoperbutylacetonicum TaxID=36745 RepID=UPI000983A260|nr:MurR/RpiR family transcriptional regulator [Clostridium saccharoperbutylacetonicum]AQR93699.1 putative HTH-type transcriptional regulator YbbH [Clostridium saccharoperbutylacetonicum]NSB29398.1 DNA-binding MurR/RpiR family transcriptional regulator [Clostridium saccharoperbutylacetonicum]
MDPISLMKSMASTYTKVELEIYNKLMSDPTLIMDSTIVVLSDHLKVSNSAITRFCKKLGYKGYVEFRYDFSSYFNKEEKDNEEHIVNRSITTYLSVLSILENILDEQEIKKIVLQMKNSKNIRVIGIGSSGLAAKYLRYRIFKYGRNIEALDNKFEIDESCSLAEEGDMLIAITDSGRSKEINKQVIEAYENGITTVIITTNDVALLRNKANFYFQLPSVGQFYRPGAYNNQPVVMVFLEILINYYAQHISYEQ